MKYQLSKTFILFTFYLCSISTAHAQWAIHMDGVPLLEDGSPDFEAPAQQTLDGHPNLSGTWDYPDPYDTGPLPFSTENQGRPVSGPRTPPPGVAPYAVFWDQGFGFENGLPFQPWARAKKEERVANHGIDNPDSHCLPLGFMQFHTHNQPFEIIQSENRIAILYEASSGVREIFLDGRKLPDLGEVFPTWYGYSVGHWEGDTLVVVSNNFRGDGWLDFDGSPTTEQLVITERFRRVNYGKIELDVTIDDPGAYTEPFDLRLDFRAMPGDSLIEWVCDNEFSTQFF